MLGASTILAAPVSLGHFDRFWPSLESADLYPENLHWLRCGTSIHQHDIRHTDRNAKRSDIRGEEETKLRQYRLSIDILLSYPMGHARKLNIADFVLRNG